MSSRQAGQRADKRAWEVAHGRYKGQACRSARLEATRCPLGPTLAPALSCSSRLPRTMGISAQDMALCSRGPVASGLWHSVAVRPGPGAASMDGRGPSRAQGPRLMPGTRRDGVWRLASGVWPAGRVDGVDSRA
jgi:hypothetical protein